MSTSFIRPVFGQGFKKPILFAAILLLAGCSQLATVKTVDPVYPDRYVVNLENAKLKQARQYLQTAERLEYSNPKTAMAYEEAAAGLSLDALKDMSGKRSEEALKLYNFAVARLVESMQASGLKPWEKPVSLAGPTGTYYLSLKSASKAAYDPSTDKLFPADRMQIGGVFFPDRILINGVGAPLVATGPGRKGRWDADKHFSGMTGLLAFSGRKTTLEIVDPFQTTHTGVAGKERPVAADMSAPIAMTMIEAKPEGFGIKGLFNTTAHLKDAKLIMMQPYRADRTPLIMTHGLSSSPATWVPMYNALISNPKIREKYQIWVFRYPSGLPFPASAALLREEIAAVYEKYPNSSKAVLMGHSMGGLISDLQIRCAGTQYSTEILGKPLDQFDLDPEEHAFLKDALEFEPSPNVSKVIFLATPHRGANMANGFFGRLVASLINLPFNMVALGPKVVSKVTQSKGEEVIDRFPNSIDTLRPNARVVLALNKIPISSAIPYYSIIGNRDGGELKESSDGIVPYFSAHLDGAKKELVVRADHSGVLRNPEAIAEVQRILLLP